MPKSQDKNKAKVKRLRALIKQVEEAKRDFDLAVENFNKEAERLKAKIEIIKDEKKIAQIRASLKK